MKMKDTNPRWGVGTAGQVPPQTRSASGSLHPHRGLACAMYPCHCPTARCPSGSRLCSGVTGSWARTASRCLSRLAQTSLQSDAGWGSHNHNDQGDANPDACSAAPTRRGTHSHSTDRKQGHFDCGDSGPGKDQWHLSYDLIGLLLGDK